MHDVGDTWIDEPTIVDMDGTKYCKWDGLEVKECSKKGVGAFVTKMIPKDLAMPYGGYQIYFEKYKRLVPSPNFGITWESIFPKPCCRSP